MTPSYTPPYAITPTILNAVAQISELLGYWSATTKLVSPQLCKENRIRTIQASLAIEQNSLSTEQVTAIMEGIHLSVGDDLCVVPAPKGTTYFMRIARKGRTHGSAPTVVENGYLCIHRGHINLWHLLIKHQKLNRTPKFPLYGISTSLPLA